MMNMWNMVRVWLGLVVWLLASPAWSAARLSGVVVLNRESGRPVDGVEIFAKGCQSGDDRQRWYLRADVSQRPAGQDVSIRVNCPGWEVVNDILLEQWLPKNANTRAFEGIICPSAEREQRVAEFYRLKNNQAVEQTYRIKLAELEVRQAATAQELDRLLRERDRVLQQAFDEDYGENRVIRGGSGSAPFGAAAGIHFPDHFCDCWECCWWSASMRVLCC